MPCTRPSLRRLAEAAIRGAPSLCVGSALLILAACGPERTVEPAPTEAVPGPDLRAQAFKLTIDTRTGRIDVAPPSGRTSSVDGLSLSLLGSEAIMLDFPAGGCVFSAIPDRSKKRCTFLLRIRNRLSATDLVTPTTFPRPPQGTSGILVFPFTAATPAGEAVLPSPDWDLGPANFFNDNTCSGSEKTDCFRYKLFPSPLYAGEFTTFQGVGFDIPASASSVTVYLVVAADLRDNPVRTTTLSAVPELCGYIDYDQVPPAVVMTGPYLDLWGTKVVFCSFPIPSILRGVRVRSASLRLLGGWPSPPAEMRVQRVNWGSTLEPSDLLLPTLNGAGLLQIEDPIYFGAEWKWYATGFAGSGVQGAIDEQQTYIQFRIMTDENWFGGFFFFAGTGAAASRHPKLVVQYTLP